MKTAFVLSGGGAKGCFQVGALKQIVKERGILPDRIYGTSTGSLQAVGYCHLGVDRLEQVWLAINKLSDVMSWNWWPHVLTLGLTLDGKYTMDPLMKKLQAIEASPKEPGIQCDAVITKVSLITGELRYCHYDEPDFLESVVASCSIPFINKPINGEWVDGGCRDQTPINGAIRDGYDRIICIINNPIHINPQDQWKKPALLPLLSTLIRVADGILSTEVWIDEIRTIKALQQQGMNIEVYMPDEYWMDNQDYDPVKIRQGIAKGMAARPVDLTKVIL